MPTRHAGDRWLENRLASFETPAARAPQDDVFLRAIKDIRHPEERPEGASRRTRDAAATPCGDLLTASFAGTTG